MPGLRAEQRQGDKQSEVRHPGGPFLKFEGAVSSPRHEPTLPQNRRGQLTRLIPHPLDGPKHNPAPRQFDGPAVLPE